MMDAEISPENTKQEDTVESPIEANGKVLVHVRFSPEGTVREIGERPADLNAQDWFNALYKQAVSDYQALAGGRGVFRLTRDEIDIIKGSAIAS